MRVLYMRSHGLCTSKTMVVDIISDLETYTTEVVVRSDFAGLRVRIFIDVVAIFGDLLHASVFTDALRHGHIATALYSLCTIRCRKWLSVPETNYSTRAHSCWTGFPRFNARRSAIQRSTDDKIVLRALGFVTDSEENSNANHLSCLHENYRRFQNINHLLLGMGHHRARYCSITC